MKKICLLVFSFSFAIAAFAQKKSNPKIDKNETEITSFIMAAGIDLSFGGQLVYRLSILKKLKIGAGILYSANYNVNDFDLNPFGYGAVFADAVQFLGHRQKWGFGGQLGHGFHNHDDYSYNKLKPGIYYNISANYRAIVSKKLLFTTSLFVGYRNFYNTRGYPEDNYGLTGLKFGVIF